MISLKRWNGFKVLHRTSRQIWFCIGRPQGKWCWLSNSSILSLKINLKSKMHVAPTDGMGWRSPIGAKKNKNYILDSPGMARLADKKEKEKNKHSPGMARLVGSSSTLSHVGSSSPAFMPLSVTCIVWVALNWDCCHTVAFGWVKISKSCRFVALWSKKLLNKVLVL